VDSRGRAVVDGDAALCPWRFAGQYRDDETGLHYNRFRYYDADAGQYISRDPLGLRAGLRVYGYVGDPGVASDPLGLAPVAGAGCGGGSAEEPPRGVVYKRTDPATGEEYIGQSKSPERFDQRQREHDSELDVEHEFEIVARAEPGLDLDVLEEEMIRSRGGLQREGGTLANKRHQMSKKRYDAATIGLL